MHQLFEQIGSLYDATRKPDPTIVQHLVSALQIAPGHVYLDLGCGTGNYTISLAAYGGQWYGIDPAAAMLNQAVEKSGSIRWCYGYAEHLPFTNNNFCGIVCSMAAHHFADLRQAINECCRILKQGRLVFFSSTPEQMRDYWLNHYFPYMMRASIARMPSYNRLYRLLRTAGFTTIQTQPFSLPHTVTDLFLYSGKHRPEIYLNSQVRQAISSFAALIDQQELHTGLQRLEADVESGTIHDIIAQYPSPNGDYIFIIAE